ncbi:hypothetical protein ACS0TY_034136 [Phlomoides rotata]
MRKQINDRVSDPRPVTDELLFNFKPHNYEYDGITDPYENLMQFENSAILHRYGERVKCRVFLTTLSKAVPIASLEVKINALTNGLRDGDLFSSLVKKHVAIFDDLLRRAEKYIILEEVQKAKKVELKPSTSEKRKPMRLSMLILNLQGKISHKSSSAEDGRSTSSYLGNLLLAVRWRVTGS